MMPIRRRVPVLLYHKIGAAPAGVRNPRGWVTPERLDWQLGYLRRRGYRSATAAALAAHYRGERPLDRNAILITFDDGSRTCLAARPILERNGFTATVFIVAGQLGGRSTWDRNPNHPDDPLLSLDEIRTLLAAGWEPGAHSLTHARLTSLSAEAAQAEIAGSKRALEAALARPVASFAYPYGSYAPEHAAQVRTAGFEIGFTTHYPEAGLAAVARQTISARVHALRFWWRLRRAARGSFHVDAVDTTAARES